MIRKWKSGLCLMILLSHWVSAAIADTAVSGVAASKAVDSVAAAIKAGTASPEQYFDAGDKADKEGDIVTANDMYRKAADGGHAEAQARFAYIIYESSHYQQALEYYRKSAEQGNPNGQLGVAMMTQGGDATTKDVAEARKWYLLAMGGGNRMALQVLADACIGLDENARNVTSISKIAELDHDMPILCGSDASVLLKKAADDDYVPAVLALEKAYRSGLYGLAVDLKMAADMDAKAKKLMGVVDRKKKKVRQ